MKFLQTSSWSQVVYRVLMCQVSPSYKHKLLNKETE